MKDERGAAVSKSGRACSCIGRELRACEGGDDGSWRAWGWGRKDEDEEAAV